MNKKNLLFLVISFLTLSVGAQEVLWPLNVNPLLNYKLKGNITEKGLKSVSPRMPFVQDFSTTYLYPDQSFFADSNVFVNRSMAYKSYTIGQATFDALDKNGLLYDNASSFPFIADYLTSDAIRLDSVFTGTPHHTAAADSVYFSFVYQPQGLGDAPDEKDSLVLEFFNPDANEWQHVWSSPGMGLVNFQTLYGNDWKCVMIPLLNADFFSQNFKFRFYNYASLANMTFPTWSGNGDLWHVDYIYINSSRTKNDTLPEDLAFRNQSYSLLKNYVSMPWNQFKAASSSEMAAEISVPYRNYSEALLNVGERIIITDLSGTSPGYNPALSAFNLLPFHDTVFYRSSPGYTFNNALSDKGEFLVKYIINSATITDQCKSNDTVAFIQRFYNYYAYDDGVPEAGYGLSVAGAKLALKFNLNVTDTLRSVQMYFNRTLNNANQLYFTLTVWADDNGKPGTILYQQEGLKPEWDGGEYNFYNYILEEPLPVSGSFYVGWEQVDDQILNLGFDKNNNHNDKVFYNIDGNWIASMYEGVPMIRPVMGTSVPFVAINDYDAESHHVYPNPCLQGQNILLGNAWNEGFLLYDVHGRLILSGKETMINTTSIEPGLYYISPLGSTSGGTRILITR